MRLDDERWRNARAALERVDVLREADLQELFVGEELDEGVRRRRPELGGLHLLGESVNYGRDR